MQGSLGLLNTICVRPTDDPEIIQGLAHKTTWLEAVEQLAEIAQTLSGAVFVDDQTGQVLDEKLVRQARRLEMEYFANKGVYEKRPLQEAFDKTGKGPIGVRWVLVNKSDQSQREITSELNQNGLIWEGNKFVW